ncbi:hypothetical protein [Nostoc sp.]|uniref:hypothetical protein n=1 Tax=Nostoc sp. TaxID=1180 RepID=UPI002FF90151
MAQFKALVLACALSLVANWRLVGELIVSNNWQLFPEEVVADTFRLTTTIQNLDDWNKWKFRSGAYLRFYYADGSASHNCYIKVIDVPTVYELPVPHDLREQGYVIRTPQCIRASRYLPFTTEQNFAQWNLKIEALI